ncbi:thioredoxin domain-containing protein 16 isoform X2 [Hemiscyllium ocellatum]|uniref:thioredoxin domain-containing protein 16 isoform X2 n=1 Tax=Hemiscyllium ocellatum TaxID=170820 RepID=UPI002966932C|nr:thioredoxin domain-containing protein 16 isoform X2 [Hemiscyllium ocellatum]
MVQWHSYHCLILLYVGYCNVIICTKKLHTLNQQHFINILQSGKTSLIYFKKTANPAIRHFLEQLKKSSESLEEYGITVAQVDCAIEAVPKYCEDEDILKKAYLFQGNLLLRSFATDTLFDVDAIVANILFILLFNEIKYVYSLMDLHDIENDMKGRGDIIFTFVRAIGVPEHRAIMETAFVYGTKYQFVLTTEQSVLEGLESIHRNGPWVVPVSSSPGLKDPDTSSARLWFCHCKMATDKNQPCKRTYFKQPLTTVNIHSYLKILEAPLVAEINLPPEEVSTIHVQLKLPVVFLFTQRETYEHDRITAESVAWQLLGSAGVVLVSRIQLHPNVPADVTVGYRPAGGDLPINYLVISSVEEIVDLVKGEVKNVSSGVKDEEEENEDLDFIGIQDDEVAEAISAYMWKEHDLGLIQALTDISFPTILETIPHVVVLFYTAWDAVSMAFLQSYAEVSTRLADMKDLVLTRVNCGDWPVVCLNEGVTHFPTVKIYTQGDRPLLYTGMLGVHSLLKFIMLSRIPTPVLLTSTEDVEAYLKGDLHSDLKPQWNIPVVGLFSSEMKEENDAFIEAAYSLRGTMVLRMYIQKDAIYLSQKFGVALPALVFVRDEKSDIEAIHLEKPSKEDIVSAVKSAMLETFPEVTVENFPSYFHPIKPLLILFIDNDDTKTSKARNELEQLTKLRDAQTYTTCWIDLRKTHVGKEILQVYLNYLPQLPALVLVQLSCHGHVFVFPEGELISTVGVLHWLEKVQTGQEIPKYNLQRKEWTPPRATYDFLAIMDIVRPGFAKQRIPNSANQEKPCEQEESETEHLHESGEEEVQSEFVATSQNVQGTPTQPDKQKKMQHELHNEL